MCSLFLFAVLIAACLAVATPAQTYKPSAGQQQRGDADRPREWGAMSSEDDGEVQFDDRKSPRKVRAKGQAHWCQRSNAIGCPWS